VEKPEEVLTRLKTKLLEIHHLKDAAALLAWDQETYMPAGGGQARAEHLATLQTMAHDKLVSPELENLLRPVLDPATGLVQDRYSGWEPSTKALLRETWRDFTRAKKLPSAFVNRLERECSVAQQVWADARKNNDFAQFLPNLRTIIALKREEAHYLGYTDSPYNALLDTYEPGWTVAHLKPLLTTLRRRLVTLLNRVRKASTKPHDAILFQSFDRDRQLEFSRVVLAKMGYDFQRGRVDLSTHPFTTSFHPTDVRVTTRVYEHELPACLFSCIHEGGHGLYEQGLRNEFYGTPLSEPISCGMHESQSRLWENCVGRSRPFWEHFFPLLQHTFPEQLGQTSLQQFYAAINTVKPSLIRVEADEVTYNLHIMVRFEIELELIEGRVPVENLPSLWNEKMKEYLGVVPERDADGILQDIHWAIGAFGYFPTYTLGNLYAAMLYQQACKDLPNIETDIAQGRLIPLKEWLNEKIHRWGRQFTSEELIQQVTGENLSAEPFLQYLETKIEKVYYSGSYT